VIELKHAGPPDGLNGKTDGLPPAHARGRANHLRAVSPLPTRQSPSRPTRREPQPVDIVDMWGYGSFPASDPPANW
jgi:hypothetical protein